MRAGPSVREEEASRRFAVRPARVVGELHRIEERVQIGDPGRAAGRLLLGHQASTLVGPAVVSDRSTFGAPASARSVVCPLRAAPAPAVGMLAP